MQPENDLTETTTERAARVEELHRQITTGTYHVPAEDIADSIVSKTLIADINAVSRPNYYAEMTPGLLVAARRQNASPAAWRGLTLVLLAGFLIVPAILALCYAWGAVNDGTAKQDADTLYYEGAN